MKPRNLISVCSILLTLVFLIAGCSSRGTYNRFRDYSVKCIDNDEKVILELYSLYSTYHVDDPDNKETSPDEYARASEIHDYLVNKYPFDCILYIDKKCMELYFLDNHYDFECAIVYYPSVQNPEDDKLHNESYEKIKDGFYYYVRWVEIFS